MAALVDKPQRSTWKGGERGCGFQEGNGALWRKGLLTLKGKFKASGDCF